MAEDELFDQIGEFLKDADKQKEEEPLRSSFQKVAQQQFQAIEPKLFQELMDHFQGKGITHDTGKILPHIFGDDRKYIDSVVERLRLRIPEEMEAASLIEAALSGQPAFTRRDGTVIVTSFMVGEPSSEKTWSKSINAGDRESDEGFVTNVEGTEVLTGRLASQFLPVTPKGTFATEVVRPKKFETKSQKITAYTPRVRTIFTPSNQR